MLSRCNIAVRRAINVTIPHAAGANSQDKFTRILLLHRDREKLPNSNRDNTIVCLCLESDSPLYLYLCSFASYLYYCRTFERSRCLHIANQRGCFSIVVSHKFSLFINSKDTYRCVYVCVCINWERKRENFAIKLKILFTTIVLTFTANDNFDICKTRFFFATRQCAIK